jgi:hypothetical protein
MWKEAAVATLQYYQGIRLEEARKSTKNLSQDRRCSGQDSNGILSSTNREHYRLSQIVHCRIWGFHSGGHAEFYLLGYSGLYDVTSDKIELFNLIVVSRPQSRNFKIFASGLYSPAPPPGPTSLSLLHNMLWGGNRAKLRVFSDPLSSSVGKR